MYKGYLELICKYLLNDIYNELTRKKNPYGEITYVYKKVHIIVM
jgi:hypothetical protein